jgi:hypothetical protein
MAYKFQMGASTMSGALEQQGSVDSVADASGDAGFKVGGTSVVDASRNGSFANLVGAGNVDLGDATSDTITATGRFDSDLVPSTDSARDLGTSALQWKDIHADAGFIDAITVTGTSTLTTVDINGGAIDGTNVTVGSGKTLDVSAGTLTTSAAQNLAIMQGAGANVDIGAYTLTATQFTSDIADGTAPLVVTSTTKVANLNVDKLDDADWAAPAAIGSGTPAAGSFTTLVGTSADINGVGDFSDTLTLSKASGNGLVVTADCDLNGSVDIAGALVANGNVDLGDATSDTITATGRFDSDLVPSTDNARDLGASGLEWKDLYLDGTANIDSLVADTAAISGGSADSVIIGGSTPAAGTFTALIANDSLAVNAGASIIGDTTNEVTLSVKGVGSQTSALLEVKDSADAMALAIAADRSVTMGPCSFSDQNLTNVGNIALDSISADGTQIDITLTDDDAAALEIKEGGNAYMTFVTTDNAENILVSKPIELDGTIKPDGAADATIDLVNDKLFFRDAGDSLMKGMSFKTMADSFTDSSITVSNAGVLSVDTTGGDKVSCVAVADGGTLAVGLNYLADIDADTTVTLPANAANGDVFIVKLGGVSGATTELTIGAYAAQTIDGLGSVEMESPYGALTLICNASGSFRIV